MRAIWTRLAPGIATLALALASGAAKADCDFLTGGGFIITTGGGTHDPAKANFGVAGGCSKKDGTPTWGHLEYIDHGTSPNLNVHGTSITHYFPDPSDSRARFICGKARTNLPAPNDNDVDFAVRALDVAEPGVDDEFDIQLTQPQGNVNVIVYTTNFNFLPTTAHKLNDGDGGGGNIKLHGPRAGDGPCPAQVGVIGAPA